MSVQERQQTLLFNQLLHDCAELLGDLDQDRLHGLIQHFDREINSRRTARQLMDVRALLTCLVARHVLRPDNVLPLIVMAELAGRPDVRLNVERFRITSSGTMLDNIFRQVSEDVQADWRNLARELAVAEVDIARIQSSNPSNYTSATMEMLQLACRQCRHPRQEVFFIQRIISALQAIGRSRLASKISSMATMDPQQDFFYAEDQRISHR